MTTRVAALTPRQRQLVRLVSLGCTNEEAAKILGLAANTAGNHRDAAMKVLGVHRTAVLTRVAIKHGISALADRLKPSERRKCAAKPPRSRRKKRASGGQIPKVSRRLRKENA